MLLKTLCVSIVLLGFLHLTAGANLWCFNSSRTDYRIATTNEAPKLMNFTDCYNSSCFNLLYIFGYLGKVNGTATNTSIDAMLYLKNYSTISCYNVFLMDWMKEARGAFGGVFTQVEYAAVAARIPAVAMEYAKALLNMTEYGFNLTKTHIVGHSAGAHLAGQTGRYLISFGKKLFKITGLDPAGPLFERFLPALNKDCASRVECVHGDPGRYGTNTSCGGIDYWPNYHNFITGNRTQYVQPGCLVGTFEPMSTEDLCSHDRPWMFMAESAMNKTSFLAIKALNYYDFAAGNGTCHNYLGYGAVLSAPGNYFLNTNASPPYGKGLEGIYTNT